MKNKNAIAVLALPVLLWLALTAALWFGPAQTSSEAERRPLAQMPEVTVDGVLDGRFMEDFEAVALDQFPLRDAFRRVKSMFHFYVLNQSDNNDIYLADGYAVKQEYPLDPESVGRAADRFNHIYETYLKDCRVFLAVIPDKGQYLAEDSGHLKLHFGKLNSILSDAMPWAASIDLYSHLEAGDYYRTDIHWRQERLLDAAKALCDAMGVEAPVAEDYEVAALERPFYGVYYGQAALPMEPETMYLLESNLLKNCRVYDYESGGYTEVYDLEKLTGRDLYDVFLSGSKSLLTIENPQADTDRELILFRDSFGSAMAPLLVQGYKTVTLVDIRYIQPDILGRFLEFGERDVLFLYSTSVLNNSETLK